MGDNGAVFLYYLALAKKGFEDEFSLLTIYNTGSLSMSGYGTALGVIRSLWRDSVSKSERKVKKRIKSETSTSRARMTHVFPIGN